MNRYDEPKTRVNNLNQDSPCGAGDCVSNGEEISCECPLGLTGEFCDYTDISYDTSHLVADDDTGFRICSKF